MKRIYFLLMLVFLLGGFNKTSAQSEVTIYTTMGNIVIELYDSLTPHTTWNFRKLAEEKYYDGVIFHRVIDKFMIQGGDPNGDGTGGPGYTIPDEFHSSLSNVQQTISMANRGPNTGGSQFFINLVNNTYLDFDKYPYTSKHAVFGIVISGFDVVQAIGKVATDSKNCPVTDVVMDSVRITKKNASGISELSVDEGIHIFPNPLKEGKLSIDLKEAKELNLAIYDELGRVIFQTTRHFTSGRNILDLPELEGRRAGIYFLTIADGEKTWHRKILISTN